MKKLIFAVAFLVCATFSFAQFNSSGYELKGSVKFVEESVFEYVEKFGEIEVGNFLGRKCIHFNENGLLAKKYIVRGDRASRDTSEIETFEYVSNDKGQIKEVNEFSQYNYRSQKSLKYKTKYKFDEAGNVIQGIKYNGNDGSFYNGYITGRATAHKNIYFGQKYYLDNGLGLNIDYRALDGKKVYSSVVQSPAIQSFHNLRHH